MCVRRGGKRVNITDLMGFPLPMAEEDSSVFDVCVPTETSVYTQPQEDKSDFAVYKHYQDNIRKCGNLRSEIMLALKQENPALLEILDKSLLCIGLMTGETVAYNLQTTLIKQKFMEE